MTVSSTHYDGSRDWPLSVGHIGSLVVGGGVCMTFVINNLPRILNWIIIEYTGVEYSYHAVHMLVICRILSVSSSSSSSCRAASTDIPDALSPLLPIVHRFWQRSRILTELLYVGSSWSSCFCSAIWGGSIGEHHLWARPCFSSSVLHVWFV